MYDFSYNFIKNILMLNCYLLTQTASLMESNQEMFMKNFFKHKHLFDLSNSLKDSKFYDNQNEMVVGRMKDEYEGILINKFIGLN